MCNEVKGAFTTLASPQTSFGVCSSRIQKRMRDEQPQRTSAGRLRLSPPKTMKVEWQGEIACSDMKRRESKTCHYVIQVSTRSKKKQFKKKKIEIGLKEKFKCTFET